MSGRPRKDRRAAICAAILTATGIVAPTVAYGATLYWDANGITAGAGTTPTGTWGTDPFWNDQSDGGDGGGLGTIGPWVADSIAHFSAGTDATGTFTVSVDSTQSAGGIFFEEGNVT